MLEVYKYINHTGQTANFFGDNVFANSKEVKSFLYELKNGYGKITEKEFDILTVVLGRKNADSLIDLLDVDANSNRYGKLYIGDWYIRCKYMGVSSVERETADKVKLTLKFYAPQFVFTKERFVLLSPSSGEVTEEILDFDFDFDFDLGGDVMAKSMVKNEQNMSADFILKFKAATDTVNINIGSNSYIVTTSINADETFVINTEEKSVYKEDASGKTNLYSYSSDINDIFEKIPNGEHIASWVGDFDISLLILEHRSVAKWS